MAAKRAAASGQEIGFEADFKVSVKTANGEWEEQTLQFVDSAFKKLENDEPTRKTLFEQLPGFKEFYEAYKAEKEKRLGENEFSPEGD